MALNPALIAFPAFSYTGGAASTSHILNTSASTLIGDVLCIVAYLDGPPAVTTPAGWTLINKISSDPTAGTFAAFYKISTVNGTEAVDVVSSPAAFGCAAVATIRSVDDSPLNNFAFDQRLGGNIFTAPSVTVDPWVGVIVVGMADDTTLESWISGQGLTQQSHGFAVEANQLFTYYDNLIAGGASPAYSLTKTAGTLGSITSATVGALGIGYLAGDNVNVATGSGTALLQIDTIDGAGGVTGFTILYGGLRYPVSSGVLTTGGTGTGFQVNILTIAQAGICEAIFFRQLLLSATGPTGSGTFMVPYSSSVVAAGGSPPYTFSISSGSLPLGLSLNASTGAITGTPTAKGFFNFIVKIVDAFGETLFWPASIFIPGNPIDSTGMVAVAVHTFGGFDKWFLSSRDDSPPGAGVWSLAAKIVDVGAVGGAVTTCSSGALSVDNAVIRGLFGAGSNALAPTSGLVFVGNGLPMQPKEIILASLPTDRLDGAIDFWDVSQGGWLFGGLQWIIVEASSGGFHMIATPDNGDSWAEYDAAHAPPDGDQIAVRRHLQSNNVDVLVRQSIAGPTKLFLWTFDFGMQTWTAGPYGELDITSVEIFLNPGNGIVRYPNDDIGIFYTDLNTGGGAVKTYYQLFVRGTLTWNAPVLVHTAGAADGTTGFFANMLQDPSLELIHFGVYLNAFQQPLYQRITHTGTLTANIFTWPVASGTDGLNHGMIKDNKIFWPYDDHADFTNAVWVATLGTNSFFKELLPHPPEIPPLTIPTCAFMIFGKPVTLSLVCPVDGGSAIVGVLYSATLIATGGTPPYSFVLLSGPAWLHIDSGSGIVSGTPDLAGTFSYTVQVTDSNGLTAIVAAPCPIVVGAPPPPPPPPFCEINPTPGTSPTLVAYNEPDELQGS